MKFKKIENYQELFEGEVKSLSAVMDAVILENREKFIRICAYCDESTKTRRSLHKNIRVVLDLYCRHRSGIQGYKKPPASIEECITTKFNGRRGL